MSVSWPPGVGLELRAPTRASGNWDLAASPTIAAAAPGLFVLSTRVPHQCHVQVVLPVTFYRPQFQGLIWEGP